MAVLSELFWLFGSILIGLWLADFATGCFHWIVDNYCNPEWPIIGPNYIKPSHDHHDEEQYEFAYSFITTHLYIWCAVALVGGAFWALGLMNLTIASACVFGLLTNVIHRWSHTRAKDNMAMVTALQRLGFFQSIDHHTFHHSGDSDTHYCLLTDHINPILETIGLWRHLDGLMLRLSIRKYWWETN